VKRPCYLCAMHRSRLAGFIIDCNTSDLPAAADFWSSALGLAKGPPEGDRYILLDGAPVGLHIEVEAPTGQRFCVVRAKRSLEGVSGATLWP
jgi:hypothetical protein